MSSMFCLVDVSGRFLWWPSRMTRVLPSAGPRERNNLRRQAIAQDATLVIPCHSMSFIPPRCDGSPESSRFQMIIRSGP